MSSARCGACLTPTVFFRGTRLSFTRVSVRRCCGLLPRITCALPSCRSAHPPQRCHPCLLLGPSLVLLSSLPLESALHRAARGSYNRGAGCSFSWFSEWSPTSLPWPAGPGLSPSALAALCQSPVPVSPGPTFLLLSVPLSGRRPWPSRLPSALQTPGPGSSRCPCAGAASRALPRLQLGFLPGPVTLNSCVHLSPRDVSPVEEGPVA